jgi:hypothetical protein
MPGCFAAPFLTVSEKGGDHGKHRVFAENRVH